MFKANKTHIPKSLTKKLGYEDSTKQTYRKTQVNNDPQEEEIIKQMEAEYEAEVLASVDQNEDSTIQLREIPNAETYDDSGFGGTSTPIPIPGSKRLYTEEIDTKIKEMDAAGSSVAEIAKAIDRSYASAMYRIRRLRSLN